MPAISQRHAFPRTIPDPDLWGVETFLFSFSFPLEIESRFKELQRVNAMTNYSIFPFLFFRDTRFPNLSKKILIRRSRTIIVDPAFREPPTRNNTRSANERATWEKVKTKRRNYYCYYCYLEKIVRQFNAR